MQGPISFLTTKKKQLLRQHFFSQFLHPMCRKSNITSQPLWQDSPFQFYPAIPCSGPVRPWRPGAWAISCEASGSRLCCCPSPSASFHTPSLPAGARENKQGKTCQDRASIHCKSLFVSSTLLQWKDTNAAQKAHSCKLICMTESNIMITVINWNRRYPFDASGYVKTNALGINKQAGKPWRETRRRRGTPASTRSNTQTWIFHEAQQPHVSRHTCTNRHGR